MVGEAHQTDKKIVHLIEVTNAIETLAFNIDILTVGATAGGL